ncbi:MAG: helix-turn-helix transcriptional regulator [Clostridia bacterium]|nr:helix-turn-helix transcriptional regulator [Clostridia bacterium]MBQ4037367.1 helix-turn-helix transcriptional regulator [Clostridia bacterium]
MKLKHKFAKTIFYARSEQKLTQAQVAENADISVRGYQRLEKGEYEPRLPTALKLMIALQINPNEFAEEVGIDVPVSIGSETVRF